MADEELGEMRRTRLFRKHQMPADVCGGATVRESVNSSVRLL